MAMPQERFEQTVRYSPLSNRMVLLAEMTEVMML